MADKPKKKPRHTKLVLPSDKPKKETYRVADRLGRKVAGPVVEAPPRQSVSEAGAASAKPRGKTLPRAENTPASGETEPLAGQNTQPQNGQPQNGQPPLPENAVAMPRQNPRIQAKKRKKRRKKALSLLAVALVALGAWLYFSGLYLYGVMAFQNFTDSMRIRLTPGGGWPAPYAITGYVASKPMSGGGFASLGDKDLALYSAGGKELRRLQHGYASPGLSAGGTRVCVYNRGGTEYAVEGRGGNLLRRTTEQEILFTTMSPGGTLAVITSSRYRAGIEIYGPLYSAHPDFTWSMVDEKPVAGAFYSDNKQFALACLSAQQGALGTTVYLLRTDKDQPLAVVRAANARVLQMEYLSQNKLLVVYDSYAATYNQKGEETARFDYNGRSLLAANQGDGGLALVFGSKARDSFALALLNDKMQPLFEAETEGTGTPRVLSTQEGVYLLYGQQVAAFTVAGQLAGGESFAARPLDLVQAAEPLVLTVSSVQPISGLMKPPESEAASVAAGSLASASAAASALPESAPISTAAPPSELLPEEGAPADTAPPPEA